MESEMNGVVVLAVGLCAAGIAVAIASRFARSSKGTGATAGRALLVTADEARRLARSVVADVALYHADAWAAARAGGATTPALAAALSDGRALFCARVISGWHRCYDEAVDELLLRPPPPA